MRRLRAFFRLPAATQALVLEAVLALLVARVLVGHVPVRYWWRRVDTGPDSPPNPEDLAAPRRPPAQRRFPLRVGRTVCKVARHAPFSALCLPQAMAAQWMLRRRGIQSRMVFGARRGRTPERAIDFHAWLIAGGECVIGAEGVDTYSPFAPPQER